MSPIGTYPIWRKAADRKALKRLTFVCGTESVLIEEVIDETKAQLGVVDYHSFNLEFGETEKFFDALYQYPLTDSPRLLLARETDKVTDWAPFYEWLDESYLSMPKTHVLLVSSAHYLHQRENGQWKKNPVGQKIMREPAAALGARGRVVECKPMSGEELIKWTLRFAPKLGLRQVQYLIQRVGGDPARLKHSARRIDLFSDYYIDQAVIDQIAEQSVGDKYVDLLVRGKKYEATLAVPNIPMQDYPRIFAQLDHMLDVLTILNSELRRFITKREQQQIPGISPWHAEAYGKISFAYDTHKVRRCRNAVAYLEDAYRTDGMTYLDEEDGILEALTTLWV